MAACSCCSASAVLASAWFAGTGTALAVTVLGAVARAAIGERRRQRRRPDASRAVRRPGPAADGARRRTAAPRRAWRNGRPAVANAARREARGGEPDERRVPGDDLARAADAAERRARLGCICFGPGKLDRVDERARLRVDRAQRPPAGAAHRRSARRVEGADRAAAASRCAPVSLRPRDRRSRRRRSRPPRRRRTSDCTWISAAGQPVVVRGDANRLRQIVWHLLANAIKFTPRGGRDRRRRSRPNDHAVLTVRDTRAGHRSRVPAADLRSVHAGRLVADARCRAGSASGLSLVRELVERHGGEITARNDDTGRGAHVHDSRSRCSRRISEVRRVRAGGGSSPTSARRR